MRRLGVWWGLRQRIRERTPGAATTLRARPKIRLRLAFIYAGLVLMAGLTLLAVTYMLLVSRPAVTAHFVQVSSRIAGAVPHGVPVTPIGGQLRPGRVVHLGPLGITLVPTGTWSTVNVRQIIYAAARLQRAADTRNLLLMGGIALVFVSLLGLAAGWLVAGRILRPLQIMTAKARRISAEQVGERIALEGPNDELKNLADTFDELLERRDRALEAERRFVANVSHELRTPLAVQKTMLEVGLADEVADAASLRDLAGRAWQMNQRSRRLIDGLLQLGRSQRGVQTREPVDLAGCAREAIDTVSPEIEDRALRVEEKLEPSVILGERVLLERMVGNLVENAVHYNQRGGWLRIETQAVKDGARVTVSNAGRVIAQVDVGDLFEPFRRGVQERTESGRGAGLGLSIVRAVALAHGGQVEAIAREEGGLTISVTLPRS